MIIMSRNLSAYNKLKSYERGYISIIFMKAMCLQGILSHTHFRFGWSVAASIDIENHRFMPHFEALPLKLGHVGFV